MKKIIFAIITMCSAIGLIWADDCPPAATSTTTISFKRNLSTILPGAFSVSDGNQVNFTKGNLQYNAAYNSWRFAENQYVYIGNAAGNNVVSAARATQDAWIDIFAWGTSGYDNTAADPTAANFQPWAYSQVDMGDENNLYYFGPSITIMPAEANWGDRQATKNYDWGVYNFTSGAEAGCRTLTQEEWVFLLSGRSNAASLCGFGKLFGVSGLFLLPDAWSWSAPAVAAAASATSFFWTTSASAKLFTNNVIENTENGRALWRVMEDAGAVFLPAAGCRSQGSFLNVGTAGYYATSSVISNKHAHLAYFYSGTLSTSSTILRATEITVRLVKDVLVVP